MDETDSSEDMTYKQQEDLPYDDPLSQTHVCGDGNFTSKKNILGASDQVILTEDGPQEKVAQDETCSNTAAAMTWDKITENDFVVDKTCDKRKQYPRTLDISAERGDALKSNISDILLHHLSKEQFLGDQGIDCETLPETSNADSADEAAVIANIPPCYVKNFGSKEQTPEFTDQLSPKRDGENSSQPSCAPGSSDLEELAAVGNSIHRENSNFLTKITDLDDKQKGCEGQESQKQQTEKASSSSVFTNGQDQAHDQLPDFSLGKTIFWVAPKVKIPRSNLMNKSLTVIAKQTSFSPKLRNKSTIVQDILENLSRSNYVEKQHPENAGKITEPSQHTQMASTGNIHQELLTGLESETNLLKLTAVSQKDLSSSSSIFQKICQGKQMYQKLKEQTDQLKTKVQEFSKSVQQDTHCHLQDRKLEDPSGASGRRARAETVAPSPCCAFCRRLLEWKHKMERRGLRRINCGRFSIVIHEQALCQDSPLGFDTGPSFSASSTGVQHNTCDRCGTEIWNSRRVFSKDPLKEFHYRYNTPGQYYFNHRGRGAFVQPCSSEENKNSAPPCSKPIQLCSHGVNSWSLQDECEPALGKRNLKTCTPNSAEPEILPPHFQSCKISGNKSLCDFNSIEKTEFKLLSSALDHALKTASILKRTTDQMIKTIAEDLAKAKRWRNGLKY
ncbi:PREDICTED: protein AKNAD1 isoform X1 [Chinchilla lanigera]|uniref:protein AKNAD1 isoform X1 n=1 Tax=Chinchilla lanigera TaxID=34839 RepID=UPI000695FC79|nr:PREDICTED: protein AKNAD1 isoform X1 [Chinchilla lanigera]